jgi:hypothetical protein
MEASMANKTGNKRSIYVGAPIAQLLELMGDDNVSGILNTAVSRYLAMVDASQPIFAEAEWLAVCDVLNGTLVDDKMWIRHSGMLMAQEMQDSAPDGVYEKWGIDGPALCKKLAALPLVQSLAVLHVVTAFWTHTDLQAGDALALAGVITAEAMAKVTSTAVCLDDAPLGPIPEGVRGEATTLLEGLTAVPEGEKEAYAHLWREGVAKGRARLLVEKDAKEGK